ncbi:MAG TPA: hypothetical protein VLA54_13950 [Acidimicrobiia bacterium]|jgi:hypothetical protein|nr:hypothetical protein [Acidimicrobiia bacterium]
MSNQSETVVALRRAGRRAAFHLMRAGLEGLKALEAIIDELAKVGKQADEHLPTEHIPVE